jgi:hypothetical protein
MNTGDGFTMLTIKHNSPLGHSQMLQRTKRFTWARTWRLLVER